MTAARMFIPVVVATISAAAGMAIVTGVVVTSGDPQFTDQISVAPLLVGSGFAGAVILWRVTGNRIGYVLAALGVLGAGTITSWVVVYASGDAPVVATAVDTAIWPLLAMLLLVLLPLWFPTGEAVSSRWAWIAPAAIGAATSSFVFGVFATPVCMRHEPVTDTCILDQANPIGVSWASGPALALAALVPILGALALASFVVRYRRADPTERAQIRWVAYALAIGFAGFAASLTPVQYALGVPASSFDLIGLLFGLALPASIMLAITRYRLYEIDRIINLTVVYAVVVGLLGAVFVAGAVWLPSLLPFEGNNVAVAASTLAVFFLFNPLRVRVQRFVDRRFYRSRYDAQEVAEEFSAELRDQVDPDLVVDAWTNVVRRTLQPAAVSVWVREDA